MENVSVDERNEIIERAKKDLLASTNIETSPDEMKVLNDFLTRCWQMGWLFMYESKRDQWCYFERKYVPSESEE